MFDLLPGPDAIWHAEWALQVCAPCTVKEWCLAEVRPAESHFDGVAGGVAWINGKPLGKGKK